MHGEEDMRLAALQKFATVRRFAKADAEPCRVLDGLYVGASLPGLWRRSHAWRQLLARNVP